MSVVYTCSEALEKLKKGNADHMDRIKSGGGRESYQIGVTEEGQEPYAAILSCADSRVIPECVFTANAGDLFVVRVAGNVANTASVASLEYAVKYLNVRVIVVLGHESCGAVDSAIKQAEDRLDFEPNLNELLAHIVPAINDPSIDDRVEATMNNAKHSAEELINQSSILREYYEKEGLRIFNGYYHVYGDRAGRVQGIDKWKCK